jgi:quercetin dioxygenase-like cupin family protein
MNARHATSLLLGALACGWTACAAQRPAPTSSNKTTTDVLPGTAEKHGSENSMSNEQAAPESKGVSVKVLETVDLGPEIEGMAGRQLRMRMITFEPGGVFGPIHDHKDRPGTVYILQGTITDHRDGVATDYGPGVGWPEDRNTRHWLENRGTIPAVEISVDIVRH